jgi:small subunit ribosomal protein S20
LPQHKSCAKRMKTSDRARQRNKKVKSVMRGTLTAYKADKEKSPDKLKTVARALDKAAAKKVIHKNKAARIKSRLTKQAAAKAK